MNQHGPRSFHDEDSTREVISGLNRTASALAVYASQGGLLHHHARLASGRWPSSTGRDWLPAGLLRKISIQLFTVLPSLPSFLAQGMSPLGPSSTGRDWLPAGFLRKVSVQFLTSLSPFPSFLA